jgi:hypothetical protein
MGTYNNTCNTCVLSVYTPVKAIISVQRVRRECVSVCVCVCVCAFWKGGRGGMPLFVSNMQEW